MRFFRVAVKMKPQNNEIETAGTRTAAIENNGNKQRSIAGLATTIPTPKTRRTRTIGFT